MNREKILRLTDNIIIVFLTVQIFSVGFSIALSSISFGIWAGLWILQLIFYRDLGLSPEMRNELKILTLFIFAFIVFDVLSRVFAVLPENPLLSLKRYLLFLILYACIAKIKTGKELYGMLKAVLLATSVISLIEIILFAVALPSYIGKMSLGEIRLDAFAHSITTGEIKMLVFLSLFPLVFVKGENILPKKYLIPALALILISLYITQSRNVFVAVFVCLIITGIVINRKFLFVFLVSAAVLFAVLPTQLRQRITSIADPSHPSNNTRLIMWNVGWKMFLDRPLLGVGDNEFRDVYKTYKEIEFDGEGSHLHSNYIMVLATHGILGMAAYLGFFIVLFLKHLKFYRAKPPGRDKLLVFGCLLAVISFHVSGIFEWNFGDWEILTLLVFFASLPFVISNLNAVDARGNGRLH